jgi:Secretion system C-terminal sorting domain
LILNQTEPANMDIHLIASNPLCSRDNEFVVEVYPLPQVQIDFISNGIAGPPGYVYEWYVNSTLVNGQTGNELIYEFPDLSDIYAVVTNEFGCSAVTNTQYIIHTLEENKSEFYLYPNPMKNQAILKTPPGVWDMRIYNSTGKLMRSSTIRTQQMNIEKNELTPGVYTIELSNGTKQSKKTLVVE